MILNDFNRLNQAGKYPTLWAFISVETLSAPAIYSHAHANLSASTIRNFEVNYSPSNQRWLSKSILPGARLVDTQSTETF
jgi:hypothetical protein